MLETIRRIFGLQKRAEEIGLPRTDTSWSLTLPSSEGDPHPINSVTEKLEAYTGWVFACASLISEDVRSNEWALWRPAGKSREDWTQVQRHPVLNLLKRPNEQQTWGTLLELTDLHYSLGGEAFWHIITSQSGMPQGLQVIYPHWIDRPIIEGGRVTGWRIIPPGQAPFVIPVQDFIRLYRPHPIKPLGAASPVEAFAVSHYMDLYFRAYGTTLLRNDAAIPAGLISTDQNLTGTQAKDLSERWKQKYTQTRGEIGVLSKGAKYQPIALPLQDIKFLELGEFTREQILAIYRVPASLLGIVTDVNRANSESARVTYQQQALLPRLSRYQEIINTFLLPRLLSTASDLIFEFENPVDEDEDAKAERASKMLATGSITVNEYRQALGYDPTSSGDVFMVPSSVTPMKTLEPSDVRPNDDDDESDDDERTLTDKLELSILQKQNRALRIELLERKHYNDLRGLFARFHREAKRLTIDGYIDEDELAARGVEPERIKAKDDEDQTEYYERLKSGVARELAHELAEREVNHATQTMLHGAN